MADDHTEVSDATREAEREESEAPHRADRPPTPDEESVADSRSVDPEVKEHYEEMMETGAEVEGEGRIP